MGYRLGQAALGAVVGALALGLMSAPGCGADDTDEGGGASGGSGGAAGAGNGSATGGSGGAGGQGGQGGQGGSGAGGGAPSCAHDGSVPDVVVNDGDDLQAAIEQATDGGVIWVGPGTYECLRIEQAPFTATAPLILRKDPTQQGDAVIAPGGCYFPIRVIDSSYVVIDGLLVDGGGIGVYVDHSDHVVLTELEVTGGEQEGVQIRNDSTYVDVVDCHIHHTGVTVPKWGECIYVGTGSMDDFPDHTEYVWLEGNDIHHCGNGEGINIKPEVFHTTARGNVIHDIVPGTFDQWNQSAFTVEGESRDYLLTTPREVWVEDNEIYDVTKGEWGHCVMAGGTGVYVVGNTIHDCEERGIYGNGFGDLGLFLVLFGNTVTSTGTELVYVASSIVLDETDPGPNPHEPQSWYCH